MVFGFGKNKKQDMVNGMRLEQRGQMAEGDNQWEQMAKAADGERQQRKIIAAMLMDKRALYEYDVKVPPEAEMDYLDKINAGEIGLEQESALLRALARPLEQKMNAIRRANPNVSQAEAYGVGVSQVFARVADSRQEMRILNYMISGKDDGFNDTRGVHEREVMRFLGQYPTPAEFEGASEEFMVKMKNAQSPQKYAQYERSMEDFKKHLYGKQQDYWEQMKGLREKARRRQRDSGVTEQLSGVGDKTEQLREREKVVVPREVDYYVMSRAQARSGEYARKGERLPDNGDSQDAALILPSKGLFGVFDGAGGQAGGREASQEAMRVVAAMQNSEIRSPQDLAAMLNTASMAVYNKPQAGYSTGTLAKLTRDKSGQKMVMWTSVGDSRMYVVKRRGEAILVTHDEGFENKITNALGMDGEDDRVRQFGVVGVDDGDRVVLCSDGITGDKGSDLMFEPELASLVRGGTVRQAAQRLVEGARKKDDRTAVIFEV